MKRLVKPLIFAISALAAVGIGYVGVTKYQELRSDKDVLEMQKTDSDQIITALKNEVELLKERLGAGKTQPTQPATKIADNEYSLNTVKVGDVVAGMTVVSVKPFNAKLSQEIPNLDNTKLEFSGKTEITGTYHYYGDDVGFYFNKVCFDSLNNESRLAIPHAKEDSRPTWFCFTNQALAKQKFGPKGSSGVATVTVDNYIDVHSGTEAYNEATLVEVVEKK